MPRLIGPCAYPTAQLCLLLSSGNMHKLVGASGAVPKPVHELTHYHALKPHKVLPCPLLQNASPLNSQSLIPSPAEGNSSSSSQ